MSNYDVYNSQLDAYELYHKKQESSSSSILQGPALPALGHALAGSTGTAISNLAIYPLDLIITRLQVQRQLRKFSSTPDDGEYKGVIDAFEKIYTKEGGLSAFYAGVVQDTGKSIADSFLFFLFYNYLRTRRLQRNGGNATSLAVLDELSVGALAGACSKFFTTPISNIVTRKQTSAMLAARSGSSAPAPTVQEIAQSIHSEKGILGFWSGYSASLVLTLNPSITFFLYEFFKRCLPRSRRDDPGARLTFLMAATSKAIASTITYPFSLAKARAQTSSKPTVDRSAAETVKDDLQNSKVDSESAEKTAHDAKRFAKRSTVFNTVLHIYRTEGPAALYEGVLGEILKGFFSHGITMLVKESVHKLIIQTYYLLLKMLNRFPSSSDLAAQASSTLDSGKQAVDEVGQRLSTAGSNATEVAKNAYDKSSQLAQDSYSNAASRVSQLPSDAKQATGVAGERLGVIGSNATEAARNTQDTASKEAGHLLGNAQEMLGDKLESLGKAIKPETEKK